jgi:ligand-binding sensor domain-containing protein
MRSMTMMKLSVKAAVLGATLAAGLLLSGCPTQPSYSATITPIYVATSGNGLYVYSGAASWTNYTVASTSFGLSSDNLTSVVVSGSGAGAEIFVGDAAGVSGFNGTSWTSWTASNGLGSGTVNRLLIASSIYAATSGGLSVYNVDGSTPAWTNDTGGGSYTSVKDVFTYGTYSYIAAAAAGLFVLNGSSLETSYLPNAVLSSSSSVQAVFVDSALDIIVGTNQGLAVLYAGSSTFSANYLPSGTSVKQICIDNSGNFYAATAQGLYIVGSSTTRLLSTPVNCVCVDANGTIYAGTASGLEESTNQGKTWTTATTIISSPVTAVATTAPVYKF